MDQLLVDDEPKNKKSARGRFPARGRGARGRGKPFDFFHMNVYIFLNFLGRGGIRGRGGRGRGRP